MSRKDVGIIVNHDQEVQAWIFAVNALKSMRRTAVATMVSEVLRADVHIFQPKMALTYGLSPEIVN